MATVVIKTIASSSTARIVSGRIDLADGAWAGATMEPASPPLPCRRAIEINIEQLIFANAPHQRGVPGIRPFLARAGLRITNLKTAKALGLKFRRSWPTKPKRVRSASERRAVTLSMAAVSVGRWVAGGI